MSENYEKIQKEFFNQPTVESNVDNLEQNSVEAPRYGCALAGVYATVLGLKNAVPYITLRSRMWSGKSIWNTICRWRIMWSK